MIVVAALAVASGTCAVPFGVGTDATAQVDAYARRSVQIMALAAKKDERALASYVTPDADFSLGAGDVGRPFGRGVQGAVALAAELKPTTYSFHGFAGIPMQRDPCSAQEVSVEFVSSDGEHSAPITFKYERGLLRSASGWWTPYSSGHVEVDP